MVSHTDVIALFGQTVTPEPGHGTCTWSIGFPDHSRSSLRLEVEDRTAAPVVIVMKSEITNNGQPWEPEPPKVRPWAIGENGFIESSRAETLVRWSHGDLRVELSLLSAGPSTFPAASKAEQVKRIARKIEAAL